MYENLTLPLCISFIRLYCSITHSQAFMKHSRGATGGHKTQQTLGSAGAGCTDDQSLGT